MNLRLAEADDFPRLREMYEEIAAWMKRDGLEIWDEIYPCSALPDDIANRRLYVLEDGSGFTGAFALCHMDDGAERVTWMDPGAKALYLDRLGVSPRCLRQGVGGLLLRHAAALAAEKGAVWLRLFVVDGNRPAVQLYEKSGFQRAEGVYAEVIDADLTLYEFGYERNLSVCFPPL